MAEIVKVENFDDRKPLARLQRHELWALADRYHVPYPAGSTLDEMVAILEEAQERGLDFRQPPPAKPQAPAELDISDMTVFQLRRVAKARGIPFEKTEGKASLLAKLRAPQAA